jgi:hypothetical protein
VQRYRKFDLKIDKRDVAHLLKGFSEPNFISLLPVAKGYKILSGVIYADDPEFEPLKYLDAFGDWDLFFSFARLGARGEPSESSILRWVSEHGLLRRENGMHGQLSLKEVEQAPITVANFRAEVLCAFQLLTLYTDIQAENVGALEASIYGTDGTRHPSSYWPHTPSTTLEDFFASHREVFGRGREGMRLKDEIIGFEESEGSNVKHWDVWAALRALQHVVENRIASVRLSFDEGYLSSPPLGSDYRIPRSWKCPDLLSALYLQFYLLITDSEPMRRCQNPACGMPFPATRKNRRFCNATCRSNARNYR